MEQSGHDVFISFSFRDQRAAEDIVNQLLNKYRITCWICTQDLRAGEHYKRNIVKAIGEAKVVLMIQSKSSMASSEVPKEISLALAKNKPVIPFIIEDSELTGDLEYDLLTVQRIDATVPTMEERIEELAKQICVTIGRDFCGAQGQQPAGERLTAVTSVIPKSIFCGRDALMEEIADRFADGERVLFLHGIGGIGKTQIAKQYAKRYRKNYDTILYATYGGSLRELILAETPFCIEPELTRYQQPDGQPESDDAFYVRKLKKIRQLSSERTLVILDNFDVEYDPDLPDWLEGRYHLLVTTRCDYSRSYPTIRIEPLESLGELQEIFLQNYDGFEVERDDLALIELIELVGRHTYTIELLAQHMERSDQTAEEMVAALKAQGIRSMTEKVMDGNRKTGIAYENLLKMFRIFSLSEEEQQVLRYLSWMPLEGIRVRDFRQWAELTSNAVIKELGDKSWIVKNVEGIALHPIIRDVVRHELPADLASCGSFLRNFTETIQEGRAWSMPKTEKDRYAAVAKLLLEAFPELTEETELFYFRAETLLSFGVDPELALKLAERLYAWYTGVHGEENFRAGQLAFKRGWVCTYNSGMKNAIEQAIPWLEKADDILRRIQLEPDGPCGVMIQNRTNLAKIYMLRYQQNGDPADYARAKQWGVQALAQARELLKPGMSQYAKLAGAGWQLADVLEVGGEYAEALDYIEEAVELLMNLHGEDNGDTMGSLCRKASILAKLGQFEEAAPLAKKAAAGYAKYYGQNNTHVFSTLEVWGDCAAELWDYEAAVQAYRAAEQAGKLIFVPGAEALRRVRSKLRDAAREI